MKTDYKYIGKGLLGNKKYTQSDKKVENIDNKLGTSSDAVTAQAISFGSAQHIKLTNNGDYWYCYGSEGAKAYLKIGCVNKYQIRTDNLSSGKKDDCKGYTEAILNSNASWTKGVAYDLGVGVAAGIVALIALNFVLPESILITVLVAAFGGLGVVFSYFIDSYKWSLTAAGCYVQIRAYGTQY